MAFLEKNVPRIDDKSEREALNSLRSYLEMLRQELQWQLNHIGTNNFSQNTDVCETGYFSIETTVVTAHTIYVNEKPKLIVLIKDDGTVTFGHDGHMEGFSIGYTPDKCVINFICSSGNYTYILFK